MSNNKGECENHCELSTQEKQVDGQLNCKVLSSAIVRSPTPSSSVSTSSTSSTLSSSTTPLSPTSSASSLVSTGTTPQNQPQVKLSPGQNSLQQQFVEEIDYNEIEAEQVVGKGSFGVVWKGRWRGRYVAIKHINTEGERRAFAVEVMQLSRVSHPNIVRLYGACTKNPVCLVMEYAEGGSLYNVLHGEPKPHYTAGHAISWALQCAHGVAYLHNMKPKPLVHRDLKPPNLLLILGGRMLKICDFGTACDLHTYMTNNKGSAAWMAPEVFEGSSYTEKCDIFSWGVILWEVLTRRKPFDDIGGSAYRIMWAVHIGQRPPLIEGCPKPLENLMIRCWHRVPEERPSMDEIVKIMTHLGKFFSGEMEPVEYSPSDSEEYNQIETNEDDTIDITWNNTSSQINGNLVTNSRNQSDDQKDLYNRTTNRDTMTTCTTEPILTNLCYGFGGDNLVGLPPIPEVTSKPPLPSLPPVTKPGGLSRIDSHNFQSLHVECDPTAWDLATSTDSSLEIQNMPGLDKMGPKSKKPVDRSSTSADQLDEVYRLLDAELRPLEPDETCQLSREIFEQHKQLAQNYLKVQTEIALVGQCRSAMLENLSVDGQQRQKLRKLEDEKESLVKLYRNLNRQLEIMKKPGTIMNPTGQINAALPGEDGWVFIPRQEPSRIS